MKIFTKEQQRYSFPYVRGTAEKIVVANTRLDEKNLKQAQHRAAKKPHRETIIYTQENERRL